MKLPDKKWFLFAPVLVIYVAGLFIDVMEVDAAQYAAMTMEMIDTGNYLEIFYRGEDYIDKPPLLFWTSALSFKLFGVSNFSYKLPSLLFTFLGLFATCRLGRLLYNERTGFIAALTLASCQAWFLINHDVRTDTILAACTILGIWQLEEFNRSRRIIHILWAALGIAGAMLSKGPIGLMVPALAIGTDFILKRKWSDIFQWQWILLLLAVFILLIPMMYGLYTQYDMSDGKQTYNGVITSGLRFYFWTQSFGRLTGESTWQNETDAFFFVHTFLWSFLPWSIFFLIAFWLKLKEIWTHKFLLDGTMEAITFGGILLPFIAFSLSRYKLPHYIYVFFPLVAILTGSLLDRLLDGTTPKLVGALRVAQGVISVVLVALAFALAMYCFQLSNLAIIGVAAMVAIRIVLYIFRRGHFQHLVMPSLLSILTVNFLLNFYVYPELLKYQSESVASKIVMSSPANTLVGFGARAYSLDFYYRRHVPLVTDLAEMRATYSSQTIWVYTDRAGYETLRQAGLSIEEERILEDFHVTTLTPAFINPATRQQAVTRNYLLRLKVI